MFNLRGAMAIVLAVGGIAAFRPDTHATTSDADESLRQFLAQDDTQHPYRATRRLEAVNGPRKGWVEAVTEYSKESGFRYKVTAEGGSGYIRSKVLRQVLDGERDVVANETSRSSIAPVNYTFRTNGVDAEGLANILISPRRKERVLINGTMFLQPAAGDLVRLKGRLAKNPSFWVRNVDINRVYERISGAVVPVMLESKGQVLFLGGATLKMTYVYSEIDGLPVGTGPADSIPCTTLQCP